MNFSFNIKQKIVFGSSLALVLVTILSFVSFRSIESMVNDADWVKHTHQVIANASSIEKLVVDLETGERGFLIAGNEEFLEPYESGKKNLSTLLEETMRLVSDNPAQVGRLKEIELSIALWQKKAGIPEIEKRREVAKNSEAVAEFEILHSRTVGKGIFDNIRYELSLIGSEFDLQKNLKGKNLLLETLNSLLDMETGQRGFLLSGLEESLEPFNRGKGNFDKNIKKLRIHSETSRNSRIIMRSVERVIFLTKQWHVKATEPEIRARERINKLPSTMADVTALIEERTGKRIMDTLRNQLQVFKQAEFELMAVRELESERIILITEYVIIFGTLLVLIISILWSFWLGGIISKPMVILKKAADKIGLGHYDTDIDISSKDEIGTLAVAFKGMGQQVRDKQKEAEQSQKEAEQSQKEAEQSQKEAEQSQKEAEQSQKEAEQSQKEAEQSQKEAEQSQKEAEQSQKEAEQSQKEAEQSQKEAEQSQKEAEQSQKEAEQSQKEAEQSQKEAEQSRKEAEQLQEEAEQLRKEAEQLRRQADQTSQTKSLFLANMSHEIRTPMNVIVGFSQVLLDDKGMNRQQKGSLETISKAGNHLLGLINDILDISKIEAGKMQLNLADFDLNEMVENLSVIFKQRCEDKDLSWKVKGLHDNLCMVNGDQTKLRQVLINLLGNAVKFTDSGEVKLTVTQEKDYYFKFEVHDTGQGIPEESQKAIFKTFHQDSEGIEKGGTGLGLAISKQQVEMMGGKLDVASAMRVGTRFFFTLQLPPLQTAVGQLDPELIENGKVLKLAEGSSVKALIVDDVPENRALLSIFLKKIGVQIELAEDGGQAIEKVSENIPDIILMDIRMPVMDGMEATEKLFKKYGRDRMKIIAYTASTMEHEREEFMKLGFHDFLMKPAKREEIFACIKKHLGIDYIYEMAEEPDKAEPVKAKKIIGMMNLAKN